MDKKDRNGHPPVDPAAKIFSELSAFNLEPGMHSGKGHQSFLQLGPDLYDGASGLALYFAAYYRVTKDLRARKAALLAISSVREQVQKFITNPDSWKSRTFAIGGFVGLGSFLYTLTTTADWLNAPDLLETATDLANSISPEWIRIDTFLDVMSGCAGTILALLAFIQIARSRGIHSRATELAA